MMVHIPTTNKCGWREPKISKIFPKNLHFFHVWSRQFIIDNFSNIQNSVPLDLVGWDECEVFKHSPIPEHINYWFVELQGQDFTINSLFPMKQAPVNNWGRKFDFYGIVKCLFKVTRNAGRVDLASNSTLDPMQFIPVDLFCFWCQ